VLDQPAPVLLVAAADEGVHVKGLVRGAARHAQLLHAAQLRKQGEGEGGQQQKR
jgi:hypothetical protein